MIRNLNKIITIEDIIDILSLSLKKTIYTCI